MQKVKIDVDEASGCCFGVVNAIEKAEQELEKGGILFCLEDIVHNENEVNRLMSKGLRIINHEQFRKLRNTKVLLRAHGEPPSTYELAKRNNIEIIDVTCPVVLNLQKKIHTSYIESPNPEDQIVIYGKIGHAEVKGLVGQTDSKAIVVEGTEDLDKIDFSKNIVFFSQTTKSIEGFKYLVEEIKRRILPDVNFKYQDTICRQVANRIPNIRKFAAEHDLIFFVSDLKSSNGKVLFEECKLHNSNSHFISSVDIIDVDLLKNVTSIGICGATSTPKWQMEEVKHKIEESLYTI